MDDTQIVKMEEERTEFVTIGTVLVCWAMTVSAYNTVLGNVTDAFGALDSIMRYGSKNKYFIQAGLLGVTAAVHMFKYSRSSIDPNNDTASFVSDNHVLSFISYIVATLALSGYAQGVIVDGKSTKRFYAWEYFTIPRERVRMSMMLERNRKSAREIDEERERLEVSMVVQSAWMNMVLGGVFMMTALVHLRMSVFSTTTAAVAHSMTFRTVQGLLGLGYTTFTMMAFFFVMFWLSIALEMREDHEQALTMIHEYNRGLKRAYNGFSFAFLVTGLLTIATSFARRPLVV